MCPLSPKKKPVRAQDGVVLSNRSTEILPAESATTPLTISAIRPFRIPPNITSVGLFAIVCAKSAGCPSRMLRTACSYGFR